jgi:hypothetical protein
MGGEFLLGLNREVREGAGVEAGDLVDVAVELDAAPRALDVEAAHRPNPQPMPRRTLRLTSTFAVT